MGGPRAEGGWGGKVNLPPIRGLITPRWVGEYKGAFGALGREWAHGAIWGYSEAISNGKQFRMEGYYECKDIPKRKLIWNAQK